MSMEPGSGVLLLTGRDVAARLTTPACIAAVEDALRRHEAGATLGPTSLGLRTSEGSFHVKAAGLAVDGRMHIVAKANMNLPTNPARYGLPTIQGVLILIDAGDGRPLAIMDSIVITSLRTGAAAAVAAKRLALPDADTVTVVGCGEQGDVQLRSMAAVRPIRRAWAVDVDRARASAFAGRMAAELGIEVADTDNLPDAVAFSQIVVTCTTSHEPVLGPASLHPGLFVAAVGADNPDKQELHPDVLARSRVVVDSLEACAAGGDLRHALAAGVMTLEDVHGELSGIVAGRVAGRTSPDEIFVFDSTGTALLDVAAAGVVYARACAAGDALAIRFGER